MVRQARFTPDPEPLHRICRSGQQQPVLDPARGRHQPGSGDVLPIEHHPRGELKQVAPPVRFQLDQLVDGEVTLPQADAVSGMQIEQQQEAGFDPDLARCRHTLRDARRRSGIATYHQLTAQRIARVHRLDLHQLGFILSHDHAGEREGVGDCQPSGAGVAFEAGGQGTGRFDSQVGRQHLVALVEQGLVHPIGEEAHRGDRGHRQHQREAQQSQLATAPVAPQA